MHKCDTYTAQNCCDTLPFYHPDNHHSTDAAYGAPQSETNSDVVESTESQSESSGFDSESESLGSKSEPSPQDSSLSPTPQDSSPSPSPQGTDFQFKSL